MKKIYLLSLMAFSQFFAVAQTTLYSNDFSSASGATTSSVQTVPTPGGTATNLVDGSALSTIIGLNATGYPNFNWNISNQSTTVSSYSVFAPKTTSYTGASGGNYAVCSGQESSTFGTQYGAIVIGPLNTKGYQNITLSFGFAYNVPDTIIRGAATGFTGYGSIAAWYNRTGPAALTQPRLAPVTTTGFPQQVYYFSTNGRSSGINYGPYIGSSSWKLVSIPLPDSLNANQDSLYVTIGFSTGTKTTTNQNAILAFDDVTITGTYNPSLLPITLQHFDGVVSGKEAVLSWQSVSEVNASKYIVQASVDNKNWADVGSVDAKGTASDYQLKLPIAHTTNYRLKLVDKDGSFTYSNQVVLSVNATKAITLLSTNVSSQVPVSIVSNLPHTYQASIVSYDGKIFSSTTINHQGGTAIIQLNIPPSLPKGIAFVKIYDDTSSETFKIFVQ
jgi:hypothetical protein